MTFHLRDQVSVRTCDIATNQIVEGVGVVIGRTYQSLPRYDVEVNGYTIRNIPETHLSKIAIQSQNEEVAI